MGNIFTSALCSNVCGATPHGTEKTLLCLLLHNVRCFEVSVAQQFLHVVNTPQYIFTVDTSANNLHMRESKSRTNLNTVLVLICPCATQSKSARFRCFFFLLYLTTCVGLTGHSQLYKVCLKSLPCFPFDIFDASTCFIHVMSNHNNKKVFIHRQHNQYFTRIFIVTTCFGLVRPSSGKLMKLHVVTI
jgi:hypothetical protein